MDAKEGEGVKILLVHPGASQSTHDVWVGISDGLKKRGHSVLSYALDARIERAGAWLNFCWKKGGKSTPRPGPSDILYMAGEELVTRALRVQPDLILIISAMFLHGEVLVLLKRAGLTTAALLTESPYDDEKHAKILPFLDYAWTNELISAERFGITYLAHGWHEDIHLPGGPVDPELPSHDVVFVGTGFQERIDLLGNVDWDGIDFGLYGSWELLPYTHRLRSHLMGTYLDNPVTTMLYRKAKIGLNLYRTSKGFGRTAPKIDDARSMNLRAYELAASGRFTVSEYRSEMDDIFGDLVPTFNGPHELRALLDRWLADDAGRAAIEAQLPAAVSGHTWADRVQQMESDLYKAGIGTPRTAIHVAPPVAAVTGG